MRYIIAAKPSYVRNPLALRFAACTIEFIPSHIASVAGLRDAAAAGEVRETAGGLPEVGVSVAPGWAEAYGSPAVEFSVSVRVSLMLEDDATQAAFDEVCAAARTSRRRRRTWPGSRTFSSAPAPRSAQRRTS